MYFNLASFDVSFKRQRASDTGAGFPERSLSVRPEQAESLAGAAQGLPEGAICCGVRVEALLGSNCPQPVRESGGGERAGRGSGEQSGYGMVGRQKGVFLREQLRRWVSLYN